MADDAQAASALIEQAIEAARAGAVRDGLQLADQLASVVWSEMWWHPDIGPTGAHLPRPRAGGVSGRPDAWQLRVEINLVQDIQA